MLLKSVCPDNNRVDNREVKEATEEANKAHPSEWPLCKELDLLLEAKDNPEPINSRE